MRSCTGNTVLTLCAEEKYPEVDSFVMVNVKQVGTPSSSYAIALSPWLTVKFETSRLPIWEHMSSF